MRVKEMDPTGKHTFCATASDILGASKINECEAGRHFGFSAAKVCENGEDAMGTVAHLVHFGLRVSATSLRLRKQLDHTVCISDINLGQALAHGSTLGIVDQC